MGNCTTKRDKMHTTQHRYSSPRIQIQIHNMSLCSWRHFYACTDRRAICATVHHSFISAAQFYIYVALIAYRSFDAQQQEVYWKCQKAAISTDPRRLLIDLFLINCLDSPMPCCLCLYLIIKFKLYIKLNHLFKSPFNIITFIISNHIFKLHNQFTILA